MQDSPSALLSRFDEQLRPQIDEALRCCCQRRLGEGCPAALQEAIAYSLLAPGKRLRPMLVLLAAETCGGPVEAAMPAACAVEMVHCYSLIHDDLPAMDDDDLRRGRPTCHKAFGEAVAILAGDGLLTLAFETLADQLRPAEVAAACCAALARAAGVCNMVGGQADDIEGCAAAQDLERLESIHRRKTGAMIEVSLQMGALSAGADAARQQALARYGRGLGLAFQITDDLLDVQSSEAATGKRVGKDAQAGKLTFPGLLGVEASNERARQAISDACAALEPFGRAADELRALAHFVLERNR